MSTDNTGYEYYIYFVKTDGFEDLLWYTEWVNETTEEAAKTRAMKAWNKNNHVRLYSIARPSNKKTLLLDLK